MNDMNPTLLLAEVIGTIENPLGNAGVNTIWDVVYNGLNIVLPLAGIIFVAMFIYAGITYIMSAGDSQKVKSAQAMMTNALIGIVIIAFAFVIQALVMRGILGKGSQPVPPGEGADVIPVA